MVDVHYFIFIINADNALISVLVSGLAFIMLRLVYKMWRGSQRCPHCGETFKAHPPIVVQTEKNLPNTLWT